ncbi:primosomal protein N' [Fodinisporobacter ferrooxydans]|uniref:Replication restart protein PriA n=1 Tax=Fodinisporobacter ferrooxydans TaxID=2901836 RepID=A0ABY4CFL6_9BACL|nr:primosomal protein N' [Alicyclobacillaceae bacterium MYW30-H2]
MSTICVIDGGEIKMNPKRKGFAEVIVDVRAYDVDRAFLYQIPPGFAETCQVGARVLVPFGSRKLEGYVVNLTDAQTVQEIKPILDVLDDHPPLTPELVDLSEWLAARYCTTRVACMQAMLPGGIRAKQETYLKIRQSPAILDPLDEQMLQWMRERKRVTLEQVRKQFPDADGRIDLLIKEGILQIDKQLHRGMKEKTVQGVALTESARNQYESLIRSLSPRARKQKACIEFLYAQEDAVPVHELLAKLQTGRSTIERLIEQGHVKTEALAVRRNPFDSAYERDKPLALTAEQQQSLQPILQGIRQKRKAEFLLHGITGSGKTEVYLQAIQACLNEGKQAIMLVPEISLTPQTVERFKKRYGEAVAVLHSRLSAGERYDEWLRIRRQDVKIVVGARSAIFAPFQSLGLIIIDEEHETSYKQDDPPKYVTHEVACFRAQYANAAVVYGSATPSFERMVAAQTGDIQYLALTKRVFGQEMPKIHIVDMRQELQSGNRTMFSRLLRQQMEAVFQQKKQMLLFLNRRGHSTFVLCRACGEAIKCPHCDISLTFHKLQNWTQLRCHYCGYAKPVDSQCPLCGSRHIRHFGTGTQKVEEALKMEFPHLRVIRMDIDTTVQKGSHERLLDAFRNKRADVLLGTQMIAKGLDFPDVTLVGVIAADTSLHIPDFRANERTFQLLSQVAGRAGRHTDQGTVVIQTYAPDHPVLTACAKQTYDAFFREEIQHRRVLQYPPFVEFASWLIAHEAEPTAASLAVQLAGDLHQAFAGKSVYILQPTPAPFPKINGKYRYHVLMKYANWWHIEKQMRKIHTDMLKEVRQKGGTLSLDINAQTIL